MVKREKVKISVKAAIQRVNRKLKDQKVCRARSEQMRIDVGDFYTVNLRGNWISEKDVDLEALAREVGALKAYEAIDKE